MRKSVILFVFARLTVAQVSFEVASIRPHPGDINFSADPSVKGNRVTATASTLADLITSAYHVRYDQISGGPSWIASEHYDLAAKAEGDAAVTMEQVRPMLQALLAERFQLKIHRETKEVPMYALRVSKNGPKFQESSADEKPTSGIRVSDSTMHMTVSKGTMAQLASRLSGNGAGRPVMDQTGLTGFYSFTLEWAAGAPGPDSDASSLSAALQEQLGLKLEPAKGPREIIIIDHAEKPSGN